MAKSFKIGDIIIWGGRVIPDKQYMLAKIYDIEVLPSSSNKLHYEVLCGSAIGSEDWQWALSMRLATSEEILRAKATNWQ